MRFTSNWMIKDLRFRSLNYYLTFQEVRQSIVVTVRVVQLEVFTDEIKRIQGNKPCRKITSWNPLYENGIVSVGRRLKYPSTLTRLWINVQISSRKTQLPTGRTLGNPDLECSLGILPGKFLREIPRNYGNIFENYSGKPSRIPLINFVRISSKECSNSSTNYVKIFFPKDPPCIS